MAFRELAGWEDLQNVSRLQGERGDRGEKRSREPSRPTAVQHDLKGSR